MNMIKELESKKRIKEMNKSKIINIWQGLIINWAKLIIKNIKNNKIITQSVWTRTKGNQQKNENSF